MIPARPHSNGGCRWRTLAPSEVDDWNRRLLATSASFLQYPYWNEPLRRLRFRPAYLTYGPGDNPAGYVCVLLLGPPGLRVALVQRGPVWLDGGGPPLDALTELIGWLRRRGCAFVRFTHVTGEALKPVTQLDGYVAADPFPFYREPREDLLVDQAGDDETVLAGFQAVARRNIRHALREGYRIECTDRPEDLLSVWPLFARLAERKRLRYRPRESFAELLGLARPHGVARLFIAYHGDVALQAILVVRDRAIAHYIIGALDTELLGDRPSPSVLLHWHAMREFARLGVAYYNLGTRSGPVQVFKEKFRPALHVHPPPATIVVNPIAHAAWSRLLPVARQVWPRIKARLFPRHG